MSRGLHPSRGEGGENRHAEDDAIPGKRTEAGAADEPQKRPDDEQRQDERHHQTNADLHRAIGRQSECRTSSSCLPNAAVIVGIATKNENSAAAGRSRPAAIPPTIVAPERETRRDERQHLAETDDERARQRSNT